MLVFIEPGTALQPMVGFLICLFFLLCQVRFSPYADDQIDLLSFASQLSQCLVLLYAVASRTTILEESGLSDGVSNVVLVLIVLVPVAIGLTILSRLISTTRKEYLAELNAARAKRIRRKSLAKSRRASLAASRRGSLANTRRGSLTVATIRTAALTASAVRKLKENRKLNKTPASSRQGQPHQRNLRGGTHPSVCHARLENSPPPPKGFGACRPCDAD